jgi:hypothetical protein
MAPMIADSVQLAGSGYRDGVRGSSNAIWLLVGLVVVGLIVARLSRSFGAVGIVVTIVLVILVVSLARALWLGGRRPGGFGRQNATKNVTPHEPALPPGAEPSPGLAATRGPSVIVIDPPDGSQLLADKLQALDRLRAEGLVTDQEYEAKRAQLIADF